jgi:hypothetical protein
LETLRIYLRSNLLEDRDLIAKRLLSPYVEYDELGEELPSVDRGQTIEQVLANRNGVVVLGDAGIGKTTFLRQALDLFSQRALKQIEDKNAADTCIIPYFLSGRNLARDPSARLANLLSAQHEKLVADVGLTFRPLFLIDGLDEISGRHVEKALGSIISFFAGSPHSFLLASRTVFFQFFREIFLNAKIDAFRMQRLTSEQAELLCLQNGCVYDSILQQSQYYGFSDMLYNPQTLNFMIEVYKGSNLPDTKSDLFGLFIRGQLKKNNLMVRDEFYEIIRDIALLMELLERNVVSIEEFEQLVRTRYKMRTSQVASVYDKLNRSGLIVAEGRFIRFEHRSLGEFLAAERIAGEPLSQIQNYVLLVKTNMIKPSWSNTLSFLIEMHDGLRNRCVSDFPRVCLEVTPSVFTADQKKRIFDALYNSFSFNNPQFLYSTNKINAYRLGYFASKRVLKRLLTDITGGSSWAKANAAFILGHVGTRKVVSVLKSVAFDKQNHKIARLSALESLGMIGNADDIDEIKDDLANEKELNDHYAITVAMLAGGERIEDLMQVLSYLRKMISMNVIEVCRKLKSKVAMEKVLDFLISHPEYMKGFELKTYLRKLLGNLRRLWSNRISGKLATLLLVLWRNQIRLEDEYQNLIIDAIETRDAQRRVIRSIIVSSDVKMGRLHNLEPIIGRCLTSNLARLLIKLCNDPDILVYFAHEVQRRKNPEASKIYEIIKPHTAGLLAKYENNLDVFRKKQMQEKKKKMSQEFRLARELRSGRDISKILSLAHTVPTSGWPSLSQRQKTTLSVIIVDHLHKTTALNNLTWGPGDTYQCNRYSHDSSLLCLKIVHHYNLMLADSTLLVSHLFYGGEHEDLIIRYFEKNTMTIEDNRCLDSLFKMELPGMGLRPLIEFIGKVKVGGGVILMRLLQLIRSQTLDAQLRIDALRAYMKVGDSSITGFLVEIQESSCDRLADEATKELVKRQHVPTILRLLESLLRGKIQIPSGTAWSWSKSGIDWFDLIESADRNVWKALLKVMNYAINNQKHGFLYSVLLRMARINRRQTLDMIQKQLTSATDTTLRSMLAQLETEFEPQELHEVGKVKDIKDALKIIASTKALHKVVIFVEGPNDIILYRAIQARFSAEGILPQDVKYFFVQKGGWDNIYAERSNFGEWIEMFRPDPIFILVDRDARRQRTISECEEIWNQLGIPYHVLVRRSPEDYYSNGLLKKVFGRIPDSKDEIKNQTVRIAKALTLQDIKGTDLYDVFAKTLKEIAESNSV